MSFWNRRRQRMGPTVYVVSSREEFAQWVGSHPGNFRHENIHDEACARGLVPSCPPRKFVVLPSADFSTQLYLHTHGFAVEKPKLLESKREGEIRLWKQKLARFGLPSSLHEAGSELQKAPAANRRWVHLLMRPGPLFTCVYGRAVDWTRTPERSDKFCV